MAATQNSLPTWTTYYRGDGTVWYLGGKPSGGIGVASPADVAGSLYTSSGNLTFVYPNGEARQFDRAGGLLTSIIDRNGNATQLTYNSSQQLTAATSPASQHLYFNYGSGALSSVVTSITSDFGVTLSYSYDSSGRLVQVTRPDLTTITYTYDAQSRITSVTDNNGKVLESHTYDSAGRGLTSSQANGVNAVNITYPTVP
jgi:YD repeat-containing protein